jgi:prepilin-type N-terminal cleavage/methylation domain-containing protein
MTVMSDQRGFTLIEMMLVTLLMAVIMGATLTAFDEFGHNARENERQNEAQDETRRALSRLARELRNLASPTAELPRSLELALPQDIIFQEVHNTRDAGANEYNTRRIRYCLDSTNGRLIRQYQVNPGQTVPATTACAVGASGNGWSPGVVMARDVVNGARPVWTFSPAPVATTGDALSVVTWIRSQLYVDVKPDKLPSESQLATGVQLRNQNRRPVADFTGDSPRPGEVVLNASSSSDPEGRALTYYWFLGTSAGDDDDAISESISFTCCSPLLTSGTHSFTLRVRDQAGLDSVITKEVVVK